MFYYFGYFSDCWAYNFEKRYYKTKVESVCLVCKSHRFKTANIKILSEQFNAETLAITFMLIIGLS